MSTPAEWEREFPIDSEALHRAAGSPRQWRLLGEGWDTDAWIADDSVVWRVPRRRVGIEALRREASVMPILATRLPCPVPVPVLVESEGLPLLARHALVGGREMAEAWDAAGPALAFGLGRFLRALHDPALVTEVGTRLPTDPLGRADPARRLPVAHRRLDQVSPQLDVEPLRAIADAGAGPPLATGVVCHGDLHHRHVLIDEGGGLAGVIDWGDCCVGAAAMDLAIVTALSVDARAAFLDAYGPIDDACWRHARLLGVMFGASLLAAAPAGPSGRTARRWLERLVESPFLAHDAGPPQRIS